MSYRRGNVFVIEPEAKQQCDLCGSIAELRPYGPKGEMICHACGKKDPEATRAVFRRRLGWENPDVR